MSNHQAPRTGCVITALVIAILFFLAMLGLFVYVIQYGNSDTTMHKPKGAPVAVGSPCPHLNAKGHTRKRVGGRVTYSTKLACRLGADGKLRWTYA